MRFEQWMLSISAIAALLSPTLVGFTHFPSPVSASPIAPTLVSVNFPASPNRRGPTRTAGGASRNPSCYVKGLGDRVTPMTVLMPLDNLGTTVEPNPALFLYFPESNIDGGEVRIVDQQDRDIYIRNFDLSNKPDNTPGIVKIELEGANLEAGKTYDWSFTPFCINEDSGNEDDPFVLAGPDVTGQFQRSELTPAQETQLKQAETPLEKAQIYARSGIWNETLNLVEQLRPSDPEEWKNLLQSVELEELAQAPYFGEAQVMSEEKSGAEALLPNSSEGEQSNNPSTPIEGLW